jgi:hypothetical protein
LAALGLRWRDLRASLLGAIFPFDLDQNRLNTSNVIFKTWPFRQLVAATLHERVFPHTQIISHPSIDLRSEGYRTTTLPRETNKLLQSHSENKEIAMKTTRTKGVVAAAALVCALAASTVQAETIDTRIGKLEVVNGFPTTEAARKLIDESDFQRATQSYLWALPAVGFHGLHLSHLNTFGAKDGDVVLYVTLKDKAGMLTPNLTTIYAMSFWNLAKQGPLVVIVPAGASAGGVLDIWQRPVTDVGQTGPDKGQGGKYLILPPGGPDIVNSEFIVLRSRTNQVWFATRGLGEDPVAAEATVRKYKLYAYDERPSPPQTKFIPVGDKKWSSEQPRDLKYFEYLHDVLEPEQAEERDLFFHGMLLTSGSSTENRSSPTIGRKKSSPKLR